MRKLRWYIIKTYECIILILKYTTTTNREFFTSYFHTTENQQTSTHNGKQIISVYFLFFTSMFTDHIFVRPSTEEAIHGIVFPFIFCDLCIWYREHMGLFMKCFAHLPRVAVLPRYIVRLLEDLSVCWSCSMICTRMLFADLVTFIRNIYIIQAYGLFSYTWWCPSGKSLYIVLLVFVLSKYIARRNYTLYTTFKIFDHKDRTIQVQKIKPKLHFWLQK